MITVRDWTIEDIPRLVALEKRCFSDPWTVADFEGCLRFPIYRRVLLEEDGEVIGYACETVLFEDGEISNVAVAPDRRGEGLGKRLMEWLETQAEKLGAEKLFLEVRVSNTPAISLYQGRGFEGTTVRKKYYPDGEDALIMVKKLKK